MIDIDKLDSLPFRENRLIHLFNSYNVCQYGQKRYYRVSYYKKIRRIVKGILRKYDNKYFNDAYSEIKHVLKEKYYTYDWVVNNQVWRPGKTKLNKDYYNFYVDESGILHEIIPIIPKFNRASRNIKITKNYQKEKYDKIKSKRREQKESIKNRKEEFNINYDSIIDYARDTMYHEEQLELIKDSILSGNINLKTIKLHHKCLLKTKSIKRKKERWSLDKLIERD